VPDLSRLIAVADLLADEEAARDPGAIARSAAVQAARLTRAGQARVHLVCAAGVVEAEYPEGQGGRRLPSALEAVVEVGRTQGEVGVAAPVDGAFTSLDSWLLEIVARRVESQLARLEVQRAEITAREVMRDAEVAGELQRALVTADRRETASARAAGDLRPARRVGGDLFDLLEADGELVAVVADVSGKGAPASLLTSALLATVQHQVNALGPHPARLLAAVDASIEGMLQRTGRIVTLVIAAVDSAAGTVRIASAGHHPVFVCVDGTVSTVRPTCPPLGVLPPRLEERVIDFPADSAVLLASDGLVDQCDVTGTPFGMERLASTFAESLDSRPSIVVARLLKAARRYAGLVPQEDDRAAVVITSRSLA